MDKLITEIVVGEWDPKVRYNKTSTTILQLADTNLKGVKYELDETNDENLNASLEGSTLAITPNNKAEQTSYLTVYAKKNGKVIAKEVIEIKISKNKKAVAALGWGIGLGLGVPAIAGAVAGLIIGLGSKEEKQEPVKIGGYIVSDPINCKISTDPETGKLIIDVIDPTKPSTVKISYDNDPDATFQTGDPDIIIDEDGTMTIPEGTASGDKPIDVVLLLQNIKKIFYQPRLKLKMKNHHQNLVLLQLKQLTYVIQYRKHLTTLLLVEHNHLQSLYLKKMIVMVSSH